jgi:prolyl oligopeptidase
MKPPAAKTESVVELLHGQRVADPYRWLEDASSTETQAFVEQQNGYTRQVLDGAPGIDRQALRTRIEQLLTIGRVEPPHVAGEYYFYVRRDGRQNQPVIYVRKRGQDQDHDRALIDVNALAQDGTVALDWHYPSPNGRYVAYGTSASGTEVSTLQVIDTETGTVKPVEIDRARAASLAWLPDESGFYYTKYPRAGDVPPGQEVYYRRVFFHALSNQDNTGASDPQIFPTKDIKIDAEHWPGVHLSENGRWLLVKVEEGWAKNTLFLKDLAIPEAEFQCLTAGRDFLYSAEIVDDQLYITTNEKATRFRVLTTSCHHPEPANWKEVIAESAGVLEETQIIGHRLFLRYSRNAISELKIADLDGKPLADVSLPTPGSIFALTGKWDGDEAFLGFTSFTIPPAVYRVSLDGKISPWARVDSPINPDEFQVEQAWFTSKDGTRVPMFIVSKRGSARSGKAPTLLSGYGGFNVGRTPVFNRNAMLLLLEKSGIYVDVQLRGGNEFGEAWHRAGMLEKKQNVFDDFSAAAEFLIREQYTDRDHLAIQGGSNGGLLVGAAITQRPELFRAAICQVPLLDMIRYHNFQIAKLWIPEYGSADDPQQFHFIYAYSPYHHVKPGIQYPATFFMTADGDTRVDPMHAKKLAALLQASATNDSSRPILLRVDVKAGHGAGKPIGKLMDDALDLWTFLFWQLEVTQ